MGALITIVPKNVEAAAPTVTLHLDDSEVEVDVGPGDNGICVFTGTVECNDHVQLIEVNLNAETEEWPTEVEPSTLYLQPGVTEEQFQVTVKVTQFTPVSQAGSLIVSGMYRSVPGTFYSSIDPVIGIITIKPYVQLSISSKKSKNSGEPGDRIDFSMQIKNEGNSDQDFTVSVSEIIGANNDQFKVSFSADSFLIRIHESYDLVVSVQIPDGVSAGEYEIIVTTIPVNQGNDKEVIERHYSLLVEVESGGVFGYGDWTWYALSIVIIMLLGIVIWKRKYIISKFRRRRQSE